jgi:hypothetical protein
LKAAKAGFLKAAERYDPTKWYRFSIYAFWFNRAEIHKLLGLPIDTENCEEQCFYLENLGSDELLGSLNFS